MPALAAYASCCLQASSSTPDKHSRDKLPQQYKEKNKPNQNTQIQNPPNILQLLLQALFPAQAASESCWLGVWMWSPSAVASSLPLFAGKIQRGKRLKNTKVSAITSRHKYQRWSCLYKNAHVSSVSTGSSIQPNETVGLKLVKIWCKFVGWAVAKFAIGLVCYVLHPMQNWRTRLRTEKNVCR